MSPGDEPVAAQTKTEKKAGNAMPTNAVVVCSAVGFLGLIVVILGVAGEDATAQAFVGDPEDYFGLSLKCVYRTTPALGLGITAGLLVLTAQVFVTVAGVFFVFGWCRTWDFPKETGNRVGVAFFSFSWVVTIIAMALFFAGAAMNTDDERYIDAGNKCTVNPGSPMFASATVLALVTAALQIASYILLQPAPAPKMLAMTEQPAEVVVVGQPVPQLEPQPDVEQQVVNGDGQPLPSASAALSDEAR